MQRVKKPRATFLEHLTYDNYFLNEKYIHLSKLADTMKAEIEYTNNFINSIYDLCGNYAANIKIVTYDGSNNIISFVCSDASGNFKPTNVIDLSSGQNASDMSRCFPYPYGYPYPYHPPFYHFPYGYHHHDSPLHRGVEMVNEDRGITTKPISVIHSTTVNGVKQSPSVNSRDFPYPYPYPYPSPFPCPHTYPYNYLYPLYDFYNNDDDYRSILTDISFNHPVHTPPNYPPVYPPNIPPVIHRDLLDCSMMYASRPIPFHRYTHG